jgi:dienelactone hydrolase
MRNEKRKVGGGRMGSRRSSVRLVILLAAALAATSVWAETRVEFESPTLDGGRVRLTGFLDAPEGAGPFPAVVLLHDSSGFGWDLGAANYRAWAERLVQWGYVALRVDSFGPRNVSDVNDDIKKVSPETRSLDAYAAGEYLARQANVDNKHIGIIGWSHGAMAGMYLVDGHYRAQGRKPFQAAVAYYPGYPPVINKHDTPLLLLYGDSDPDCPGFMVSQLVQYWSKGDRKYELKVKKYPNATHLFDVEGLNEDWEGEHFEYNPAAAADSIEQVRLFFAKYLGN